MTLPTLIILALLAVVVVFAVKHTFKTKGCDCGCQSCKYGASCHKAK
ncbi:putative membrane protein [Peptoniphilus sp. ING2-D1G]|nr:putative membrane protein [Peptoniphilus sp. ING2-D1G]